MTGDPTTGDPTASGPIGRTGERAVPRLPAAASPSFASAQRRRKIVAIVVLVVGVFADLWTKDWMQELLGMHPAHPESTRRIQLIPTLALEGTWNTGVTFGFAQGQTHLILLFTVVAICLLITWLIATRSPSRLLHLGLGLVIGGALGNLYDRWHWQKVRDFILFYLGDFKDPSFRWPNFNVADSMIVVGVGLILWEELFGRRRREAKAAA